MAMIRKEILISGFGGQGVVMAGRILGYATVLAGLRATMLVSHGTETRGGYVRSQVVVSDDLIDSPAVERPDIFCALSQAAYGRFLNLVSDGVVLYDPDFVTPDRLQDVAHFAVPARALAVEKVGNELSANIVVLGVILQKLGLIPLEQGLQAVREIIPRYVEINLRALEIGCQLTLERGQP
jgi:2-oxoglutarate ferredoxin oxidoreductase subunit gamma